jgi:hypothetical protein
MLSKPIDPLVQSISPQIAQALIQAGFLTTISPQIAETLIQAGFLTNPHIPSKFFRAAPLESFQARPD